MVIKSATAHIFHVGDSRIYRVAGNALEQLTDDHRVVVSSEQSYLSRALGVNPQIEIDYRMLPGREGRRLRAGDRRRLRACRRALHRQGDQRQRGRSGRGGQDDRRGGLPARQPDNLTVQIVRIDELPDGEASELFGQASELPLPPLLEARMVFDGYRIVRELHGSSRSHIYLAVDTETDDAGRPQDPLDRPARRSRPISSAS